MQVQLAKKNTLSIMIGQGAAKIVTYQSWSSEKDSYAGGIEPNFFEPPTLTGHSFAAS